MFEEEEYGFLPMVRHKWIFKEFFRYYRRYVSEYEGKTRVQPINESAKELFYSRKSRTRKN